VSHPAAVVGRSAARGRGAAGRRGTPGRGTPPRYGPVGGHPRGSPISRDLRYPKCPRGQQKTTNNWHFQLTAVFIHIFFEIWIPLWRAF
jgi:hypothetical protein